MNPFHLNVTCNDMSLTSFRRMQLTAYQFSRLREKTKHAARRGIVWYAPQRPRDPTMQAPSPEDPGTFSFYWIRRILSTKSK